MLLERIMVRGFRIIPIFVVSSLVVAHNVETEWCSLDYQYLILSGYKIFKREGAKDGTLFLSIRWENH